MDVLGKAKDITKFIRNDAVLLDKFKRIQTSNKNSGLLDRIKSRELPVDTRWYSSHGCIRSVLLNKDIDRMLSPITKAIGDLESDRTNLSRVYEIFQTLRYNQAIKYLVDARWAFLHTESMGIAYLLNPATHGGEGFVGSDKIDSYESLKNYYEVTVISKITQSGKACLYLFKFTSTAE